MYRGEAEVQRKRRRQEGQTGPIRSLSILVLLTLDPVNSWVPVVAQASLQPLILLSLVEKQSLNRVIDCDCSVPDLGVANGSSLYHASNQIQN